MAFAVAVDDNGKTVLPVISASANLLQITIVVDVNAKPCNSGPERLPLRVGERIPILENFPDAVFRQSQFLGGCLAVEKKVFRILWHGTPPEDQGHGGGLNRYLGCDAERGLQKERHA